MTQPAPAVVLVPGVGLGGAELLPLARALRRRGWESVRVYWCLPWCRSLDDGAARLARWLERRPGDRTHFVGHSLGGLTILRSLALAPQGNPVRVVTLGTPHRRIEAAHTIARLPGGRRLLGHALRTAMGRVPLPVPAGCTLGAVAGDLGLGIGAALGLPRPNDSVVGVAEALHPDAAATIVLGTSHSGLLLSRRAADATDAFLRGGSFS